jgi:exonuclease III
MTIGTWNVRETGPRKLELLEDRERMKSDTLVATETKKGKGSEELERYYYKYSGIEKEQRGASKVAIIVKRPLKKRTVSYSWVSDRTVALELRTGRSHCLITGVYAPRDGQNEGNERFYIQLQK